MAVNTCLLVVYKSRLNQIRAHLQFPVRALKVEKIRGHEKLATGLQILKPVLFLSESSGRSSVLPFWGSSLIWFSLFTSPSSVFIIGESSSSKGISVESGFLGQFPSTVLRSHHISSCNIYITFLYQQSCNRLSLYSPREFPCICYI